MHPVLLTTPFFTLYTFGVLLAAAYLSALGWMVRGARRADNAGQQSAGYCCRCARQERTPGNSVPLNHEVSLEFYCLFANLFCGRVRPR